MDDKFTREEIILLLMVLDSLNNFGESKIFNLQEYVAQSWKMFFGEPQEVLLKFSQSLAPLVKNKFTEGFYEIVEHEDEKIADIPLINVEQVIVIGRIGITGAIIQSLPM